MRHFFLSILFMFLCFSLFSQSIGNEWITYNQKYCRIPIVKTGIYRINRQTLINAGVELNHISPQNIQIFARGEEQYIYIAGENDGIFNTNDYIEFFAYGNDGLLDSLLYENPADLVNPYQSLINDTIYYFLTWNNSITNRRVSFETDLDFQTYQSSLAQYCYVEKKYTKPYYYYQGDLGSWYNVAEGWAGNYSELNSPQEYMIPTENYVDVSMPVTLKYTCFSASNAQFSGVGNHHLRFSFNNQVLVDTVFTGFKKVSSTINLYQNLPSTSNFELESVDDLSLITDKSTLSNASVYYPHNFTFTGARQVFDLKNSASGKTYVELNVNSSAAMVLWDVANHKKIPVLYSGGKYKALIPNGANIKHCIYSIEDSVYQATVLDSVNYKDYTINNAKADYLIITHPSLVSSAIQYANYRNSTGYKSEIIDINQLYDQYAYGIPKNPIAIQRFLYDFNQENPGQIKHVFLIGKGIHSEMIRYNSFYYKNCLIPTFGTPPSDEYLTKLPGQNKPLYSLGRLAAESNNEVLIYLNKVIQYESMGTAEWQKRVLHFGGGSNTSEQLTFEGYLNSLANIIQDTLYSGFVQTFLKTTSLPIQITLSDSIRKLINDGCSIMNFFGHGTSGGFDQNIDDPSSYLNTGKYPLLLANTCWSGDIHLTDYKRIAENWVIIPQKGAIAFMASTDVGNAGYLYLYSSEFYRQITYKNFNKPLGTCIKETVSELLSNSVNNLYTKNTCYDITLHGDPAVVLLIKPLPDLTVHNQDISFVPNIVTSDIDTFDVHVIITNYGRAVNQPFSVDLTRSFADGSTVSITKEMHSCFYKDTIIFRVPVDIIRGPGLNNFCVKVDAENWIQEYDENNNTSCVDFSITISDIVPVFPSEYAIYPNDTVTLIASTGYPFLASQNFIFEIDTTDLFNSTLKLSTVVNHQGGVLTWKPQLQLVDSTVYYWHVALNDGSSTPNWKESSFIYINGKTGWSQAHYFQFKKDRFQFINYNRPDRSFDFINTPRQLRCLTGGTGAMTSYFDYQYNLESIVERSSCEAVNAMLVVVIDPETIIPWQSNRYNYGQTNFPTCSGLSRIQSYYVFKADSEHLSKMADFIRDTVPNNYYLLVYNFLSGNFPNWPDAAYQSLELLGAVQVRTLGLNNGYVFFCKKGDYTSIHERVSSSTDTIMFIYNIPVDYTKGNIYSTLIGPSTSWQTLHWLPKSKENPTKDRNYLSLTAYRANFDSSVVIQKMGEDTLDLYSLNQIVDASVFPYLRLSINTSDDSLKTPTQLKRWQLTFDGVPETAINPEKGYYFYKDTVQEGETIKFGVATQNVSPYNMDSLLVKYWLQDKNNNVIPIKTKRLRPHPAGDILIDTIAFDTFHYPGLNHIWYEVNCANTNNNTYDQLEQTHFNNIAEKAFYVSTDKINPLLDVTFDGVRILDGDIVSAKPNIVIQLKDENRYLELNDTSLFAIYLTDLKNNIEKRIYFINTDNNLTFYPASLPANKCKINYNPELTDGKYLLRVQAKDISNNNSGYYDYTINFEVITKQSITYVLNYPNPFSTSTRFVFTLTGFEVPDEMRIRIYTISGRLVKEIKKEDLGVLHIGRNITDYVWDGTDDFGDKLANGVYFYQVEARYQGVNVEHRETDADKFFKHSFGKLYILR